MARASRSNNVKATGDPKILRNACERMGQAGMEILAAIADVQKSGIADDDKVVLALERVNKRVDGIAKRINPDAAAEREHARKLKKIGALEKRVAILKAELKE